ncbi:hypothetical protein NMY22_g3057 [Coprinellus aureogranulatus]|nr:hypothetical protein NMY22_g3057 [Coprinellus aureogranulatus]
MALRTTPPIQCTTINLFAHPPSSISATEATTRSSPVHHLLWCLPVPGLVWSPRSTSISAIAKLSTSVWLSEGAPNRPTQTSPKLLSPRQLTGRPGREPVTATLFRDDNELGIGQTARRRRPGGKGRRRVF